MLMIILISLLFFYAVPRPLWVTTKESSEFILLAGGIYRGSNEQYVCVNCPSVFQLLILLNSLFSRSDLGKGEGDSFVCKTTFGVIQGVRRTHGQPTEEPRGNHGELFRAILRFAEHLRENHGGTTENPFG